MQYKIYDIDLNDNDKYGESIQAILYQHQRAINELIDEMKRLNPNFKPISDIIMYLGLTQDEEYINKIIYTFTSIEDIK